MAGNLVAERQVERMVGADAVVKIAEIGMADAASGDGDDDFAFAGGGDEIGLYHRLC